MRIGRYELFDRIGIGGMAEVFRARAYGAEGFQKNVVLKRILPHLSHDAEFKSMFVDEAKITVDLQHANIVQVLDLGQIDQQLFIAMELVEGTDVGRLMRELTKQGKAATLHDALYIAIETLKGLHYAHGSTVVHRDVSPSNILISYAGEVKIGDFGIATAARRTTLQTQQGIVKGKLRYMSIEQLENLKLDARADVASMGRVMVSMLTGEVPYQGMKERDIIEAIRDGTPVRLPTDEPELVPILKKATAHLRQDRYQSAEEFQEALSDFAFARGLRLSSRPLKELVADMFPQQPVAADRTEEASLALTKTILVEGVDEEGLTALRTSAMSTDDAQLWTPTKRKRWRGPLVAAGVVALLSVAAVVGYPYLPTEGAAEPSRTDAVIRETPVETSPKFATGFLNFDVQPWAEVSINGKPVGVTPVKKLELPVGAHWVTYETPDGEQHKRQIKIRKGKTETVKVP